MDDTERPLRWKVLTVALDPISEEGAAFAQLLVPVPLREEQKERLRAFVESL